MIIRLNGTLNCEKQEQVQLVRSLIGEHTRLSRLEPGCLKFEVKETENPLIWAVSEEFVDQRAFDAHQRRVQESEWGRQTAAIHRDYVIDSD